MVNTVYLLITRRNDVIGELWAVNIHIFYRVSRISETSHQARGLVSYGQFPGHSISEHHLIWLAHLKALNDKFGHQEGSNVKGQLFNENVWSHSRVSKHP